MSKQKEAKHSGHLCSDVRHRLAVMSVHRFEHSTAKAYECALCGQALVVFNRAVNDVDFKGDLFTHRHQVVKVVGHDLCGMDVVKYQCTICFAKFESITTAG